MEPPGPDEKSGHHLFTVLLPRKIARDAVLAKMQEEGIGVAVNYRAVHTLTFFKEQFGYRPEDFPNAFDIGRRTISLPLYPKLTEGEIETVSETLKKTLIMLS
jgi:dTDP-4-amino-4,6-dideoxygalactose transaminase